MSKLWKVAVLACGLVAALVVGNVADAGLHARKACCEPVCCVPPPPPPVEVTWCVEDPCTCCKYTVSACLPACCACQVPCLVDCRPGICGRKILTYKFPCGECVEVVITKHGRTIVRD
ncbi:MAG: hypothetical protein ACTHK7_00385 [Aureliella sp.]